MSRIFNIEGSSQDPGGNPPSGGGGSQPGGNLSLLTSTGGLSGVLGAVLLFATSPINVYCAYKIDPTNFVCEDDAEYIFKAEEIEVYRQPTVSSVIFRFRDIGKGTFTSFIQGNQLQKVIISQFVTTVVGGLNDGVIKTAKADFNFTCESPQLIVTVPKGFGPVSFTKVMMEIEHGDTKPV